MVIVALTPDERARHERAIEKIKRKLFARRTPDDYGIVPGSEKTLSATAEQRWCASIGEYRRVTWGGLRFEIAIGSSRYEMTISHFERNVFSVHAATERGHTELAALVEFDGLDRIAWRYIQNRRSGGGRHRAD
jgi:hypothetical protein